MPTIGGVGQGAGLQLGTERGAAERFGEQNIIIDDWGRVKLGESGGADANKMILKAGSRKRSVCS